MFGAIFIFVKENTQGDRLGGNHLKWRQGKKKFEYKVIVDCWLKVEKIYIYPAGRTQAIQLASNKFNIHSNSL